MFLKLSMLSFCISLSLIKVNASEVHCEEEQRLEAKQFVKKLKDSIKESDKDYLLDSKRIPDIAEETNWEMALKIIRSAEGREDFYDDFSKAMRPFPEMLYSKKIKYFPLQIKIQGLIQIARERALMAYKQKCKSMREIRPYNNQSTLLHSVKYKRYN